MQTALGQAGALQLWLGHPVENVVVAPHVLHEVHGLAATGIAVAGLAVPLLLRQAIQAEGDLFIQRLRSPEALEALSAFMQRRQPDFSRFN